MSKEVLIYDGQANTFSFRMTVDEENLDPRNFSHIEFIGVDGVDIDTDVLASSVFDLLEDRINIKLGLLSIPVGRHYVKLVGYDLQNPEGIVFGDLVFQVVEA